MNESTNTSLLKNNAVFFSQCLRQSILDMVGAEIECSIEEVKEIIFKPTMNMVAMIHFTGPIQGEYVISLKEEAAAAIISAYNPEMTREELLAQRSDYAGFIKEALNVSVGAAITKLSQDFEDLTFLSPTVIYGEIDYPSIPCGCVIAKFGEYSIECMFSLNMMGLELGDRLQATLLNLQNTAKQANVARRNMESMLASFPLGLTVLNKECCILPGYSVCTPIMLGLSKDTKLDGAPFLEAIGIGEKEDKLNASFSLWINLCYSQYKAMGFKDLIGLCPLEEKENNKGRRLKIDWIPMEDDVGELSAVLAMIEDVTEKRALEEKMNALSKQHTQSVELMSQIVNLEPDEITEFVFDSSGLLEEAKKIVNQSERDRKFVDTLYRTIHTLKGNSGQFQFKSLQTMAADMEIQLNRLRDGESDPDQENLTAIISGIQEADGYIQKLQELRAKLGSPNENMASKAARSKPALMVNIQDIKKVNHQLVELIAMGKQLALSSILLERLDEIRLHVKDFLKVNVRQYDGLFETATTHTAEKLHKDVKLIINGDATIETEHFRKLHQIMTHLINNSIDHGIEFPEARMASGKLQKGIVHLEWSQEKSGFSVTFRDDGAGINTEFIKKILFEKHKIEKEKIEKLSNKELLDYLFLPGFTTRSEVTDTSGRGVGLDVVKSTVEELHGEVLLESTYGKGSAFIIQIPEKDLL